MHMHPVDAKHVSFTVHRHIHFQRPPRSRAPRACAHSSSIPMRCILYGGRLQRGRACEYKSAASRPRKTLATKLPPGRSTAATTVSAASTSCACTNSSTSCRPVTARDGGHNRASCRCRQPLQTMPSDS